METKFNFNSQVATTKIQSERLLELGLKKETADCYWFYCDIAKEWKCAMGASETLFKNYPTTVIPAWSLFRLWELLGKIKKYEGEDELLYPRISLVEDDVIAENPKSIWVRQNFCCSKGVYENIINCIEWLIKNNGFEDHVKDLFTTDMIKGLAREEEITFDAGNFEQWSHELLCPDGYEFHDENGNVINTTKIVLEKKKTEYPKTYEECAKVLLDRASVRNDFGYKGELLVALQKLLVCRDAYWKIAGDWKPDWAMYSEPKHCIIYSDNQIKWQGKSFVTEAKVLAFPTGMMRDIFYENFKDLIEQCKELI